MSQAWAIAHPPWNYLTQVDHWRSIQKDWRSLLRILKISFLWKGHTPVGLRLGRLSRDHLFIHFVYFLSKLNYEEFSQLSILTWEEIFCVWDHNKCVLLHTLRCLRCGKSKWWVRTPKIVCKLCWIRTSQQIWTSRNNW